MEKWICPNDRQLALRAKLGTGWSYFTNRANNEHDRAMTQDEYKQIADVLKRKEICDEIEKQRIGHMVLHLQNIKRNQSQRYLKDCHICGHNVILLSLTFLKKICDICKKTTCDHCLSDVPSAVLLPKLNGPISSERENIFTRRLTSFIKSQSSEHTSNVKICKYCFETREIWKRSGAWRQEQLPDFHLPTASNICPHPETCSKVIVNSQSANIDSASWETYRRLPKWTTLEENDKVVAIEELSINEPAFEMFSFNPFDEEMKEQEKVIEAVEIKQSEYYNMEKPKMEQVECLNQDPLHKLHKDEPPVGSVFWSRDSIKKPKKKTKEENLGYLNYKMFHDSALSQLIISILNAKDLKSMDSNGLSDPYVKCNLLPGNTHRTQLRTKTCYKTLNPIWNENLVYHGISRSDMDNKTLRLAVLDEDKFGFDWIGEYRLFLSDLNSDEEYNFSHKLICRQPIAKGFDDLIDHERGKILLSLLYDKTNSTLRVNIIRCAELAPMDCNGFSDPFCKIYLKPDKLRITKRKTQIKKMTLNPYFNEEFIIELDPNWCKDKILEISVWDYDRGPKNDFIGCVKFHNRAKGDRGRLWRTISEKPNKSFEGWFILCADMSDVD